MSQPTQGRSSRAIQIRWTPRLITFIALLVLVLIFAAQNFERVDVTIFFWEISMPLVWALLAFTVIGAVLGWMVPRIRSSRRQ
jgi:uncharacterized integral membrane protein